MISRLLLGISAIVLLSIPADAIRAQGRSGGATGAPTRERLYADAEHRAAGRALMDYEIQRHGRVDNPAWNREVDAILRRLAAASGHPGLQLTFAIVGSDTMNAMAGPGGHIVIYKGLIETFDSLARRQAGAGVAHQDLHRAFLAAVLSHEIAHVTLGHSDSLLIATRRSRLRAGAPDTAITESSAYLAHIRSEDPELAQLRHARDVELAADRAGALYLLRAGWEIQHAMDLFRAFDAAERDTPGFFHIANVTYLRSHPRSSDREARLEMLRGQLKLRQSDFDDALTLVRNGMGLDSAVVLLDRVLADFPGLLAAQHARAVALHRRWLAAVPVQTQQVRASFPTYSAHFLPGIKGAPEGSDAMLRAARAAYASVLAQRQLPYTMANLALLEAYGGETQRAQQRADSAARLDPRDPLVANNQGVVHFVAGRYAQARQSFERAQSLLDGAMYPPVMFNLARTLVALRDPAAPAHLERYLQVDDESGWAAEAARLLGRPPTASRAPGAGSARTESLATAPSIAGLRLGGAQEQVVAALGRPPEAGRIEGHIVWRYQQRGITVVFDGSARVAMLIMTEPSAGTVDGVKVGDSVNAAVARWGAPSDRDAGMLFFLRGGWFISVEDTGGTISALGIGGTGMLSP